MSCARADDEQRRRKPVTVGVAGGTGAGKTTISRTILERIGAERIAYVQHDAYYRDLRHLPMGERRERNFDHPDALEDDLLLKHLRALLAGRPIALPTYDFRRYVRLDETKTVDARPVILLEGILIFANPDIRNLMDIKIYVDTDADVRLIRRLRRDIEERGRNLDSVIDQYMRTVRPMHLEFVEPSKRYADVIVPEGGHNRVAIDMICTRIQAMLEPLP